MSESPTEKLFEKHAHFLRKHSFKLLSIGVSLVALITAFVIHSDAEQSLATSKAMLQQQQAVNLEADQAAMLLNQYLTPYRALQERRVIAPPERLQWLETLQADVNENLIPKMDFVLSPTVPANTENTIYMHESIGVKVTPMRIGFVLLHEGDMLRLLNDMHTQANGLFSVNICDLERNEASSAGEIAAQSSTQINFKGYCELLWYSLTDITGAWEATNEPH